MGGIGGGNNPLFEPFMDSLRIAVPLVISQRRLDAEKEQADRLFQSRANQILMQAKEAKSKVALDAGMKMFEEGMKNVDPNDPESVRRTLALGVNLEKLAGIDLLPVDETGAKVLPGITWKKPGITEAQQANLDLRRDLGEQSRLDREEARKDRMAIAQQAAADRQETIRLREETLAETKRKNNRDEQGTKPEKGKMWNEDRTAQIPIPGSDADRKIKSIYAKEKISYETVTEDMNRLESAATELANHPGLNAITGLVGSWTPDIRDKSRDASAKLKNLKSQIFVNVLANMRKASPTGGAVGNVTEKEGDKLEAAIASLERAQTYEEMKRSIETIAIYARNAKIRVKDAFGTWDEIINPQGIKPVTEKSLDIKSIPDDELIKQLGIGQ